MQVNERMQTHYAWMPAWPGPRLNAWTLSLLMGCKGDSYLENTLRTKRLTTLVAMRKGIIQ